jgi:zinc transport system substrate-binding protein
MSKFFYSFCLFCISICSAADKPVVFTGIAPYAFFVQKIAGPKLQIEVFVPSGQSPHTFSPSFSQMMLLKKAHAYIRSGQLFEQSLIRRAQSIQPDLRIINALHDLKLSPMLAECDHETHEHNKHDHAAHQPQNSNELDLHVWLSPRMALKIAWNISRELSLIFPESADIFQQNLAAFTKELKESDQRIRTELAPFAGRSFYVFHPSFGYFAEDYNLKQVAIESQGKEPGSRSLALLIRDARRENIRIIFTQPQFSQKSATTLAKSIKGKVVAIDPLAMDYFQNLDLITKNLKEAFLLSTETEAESNP